MRELRSVNLQLATMLLIQDGNLSVSEIEALPFVETRDEAYLIAQKIHDVLSEHYDMNLEDGECLVISGLAVS